MRRFNLTELAANPEFISGIYNYCDRWCERCPFSGRCLLYAQEKEDDEDWPESRDSNNKAFWLRLASIFQETRAMIQEWAKETGIDLNEIDVEEEEKTSRRRRDRAWRNRLAVAGKEYASSVTEWFAQFDQTLASSDVAVDDSDEQEAQELNDAREVIYWYQYQIAVKTMRALSSSGNESEDSEYDDVYGKDSDGSAKVALIGIDRSISAWRIMQLCVPERADSIVPIILQLEKLRQRTERRFPQARSFIRPGFDEVQGEAN
jgi:hypothetical protein